MKIIVAKKVPVSVIHLARARWLSQARRAIAFGMNEKDMDESKLARVTGWSFGLLAQAMLGLTVLDH